MLSTDVLCGSAMTANECESTWCTDNDCEVMTTSRTDGTALRPQPVHDSPLLQTCSDGRRARIRETLDAFCRTNDSGKCNADMRRRHIGYTAQQPIHLSPRAELVMMATRHHGQSSTTRAVCQQQHPKYYDAEKWRYWKVLLTPASAIAGLQLQSPRRHSRTHIAT